MIKDFELTSDFVQFTSKCDSWEEAVRKSSQPLLDKGLVQKSYIDAMIDSVNEHGPYIVIAPNIALPHARPETGSLKIGYSVMLMEDTVSFTEDGKNDARLFIALSCVDSETHLEMLQEIVMILSDSVKHDAIFAAKSAEEILAIFNG